MQTILLLNGPNLNLLGTREPERYGSTTLAELEARSAARAQSLGFQLRALQSNHEGVLIDALHAAGLEHQRGELLGVLFNPGGYTHTSVALRDAVLAISAPVIEIHISNVHAREPFRQHSYLSGVVAGVIMGFGVLGYDLAMEALIRRAAQA